MRNISLTLTRSISLFVLLFTSVIITAAQAPSDTEAIKQTALDYVEGWYEGNPERMERALHPELAKRIVVTDARGRSNLEQMGALRLVQYTRGRAGKTEANGRQQKDVVILDVFGNTASVRATMADWIDYMHMAKWNGRWVIVNVLWERKGQK